MATLGLLFAVAVAGTFVVAILPLGGNNERYMVHANVGALIQGRYTYWTEPPDDCYGEQTGRPQRQEGETRRAFDRRCSGERTLSVWGGLGYVAIPTILVLALGITSFRRRDVP